PLARPAAREGGRTRERRQWEAMRAQRARPWVVAKGGGRGSANQGGHVSSPEPWNGGGRSERQRRDGRDAGPQRPPDSHSRGHPDVGPKSESPRTPESAFREPSTRKNFLLHQHEPPDDRPPRHRQPQEVKTRIDPRSRPRPVHEVPPRRVRAVRE